MHQTSRDSPRLVRLGVFELDLRAGELRKSGVRLRLQQQPLQLLSVLLERPGEIVTREELRRRLWPGDTFVDFEHGLTAGVKRLRDTLGDTADSSRFIETLPKRGYRFVASTDVRAAPISLNFPGGGARDAHSAPIVRLKRGRLLVALAVVIAAAGVWVYRAKPGQVLPAGSLQVMPFTTFPGQEVAPTFSPDGSQIAFARSPGGPRDQFDLYVRVIGSEKALAADDTSSRFRYSSVVARRTPARFRATGLWSQLTSEGGGFAPQPSADGARIYYGNERGIYSVSTAGGAERRLVGLPPLNPPFTDAWALSPTGIYFINPAPPRRNRLLRVRQRLDRVVDLPGRPAPWGGPMAISRDGRRLLYPQPDGVASDIMLIDNFR